TAGEITRTDVAQAESSLAQGRSQLSIAESNYVTARAQYQQVIGVPAPSRISPAAPVDRLSPRTLDAAIGRGRNEHPTITTAMYNVDVALQQVKVAEGALSPTLSAVGNVQKQYGSATSLLVLEALSASVAAAEVALNGVREEARVGQRTTLDVLNAQQTLVNARSALVTAQRDRVVASYTVLAAVGSLSPQVLGLRVPVYDPMVHYQQVRDVWGGVRIPDGR